MLLCCVWVNTPPTDELNVEDSSNIQAVVTVLLHWITSPGLYRINRDDWQGRLAIQLLDPEHQDVWKKRKNPMSPKAAPKYPSRVTDFVHVRIGGKLRLFRIQIQDVGKSLRGIFKR